MAALGTDLIWHNHMGPGQVRVIQPVCLSQFSNIERDVVNTLHLRDCLGMVFPSEFILNVCIFVLFQLPLVLDNHSEGIDIRFWVKVISATSDQLEEVIHGSLSPASFKGSAPAIFRRQETVASSARAFTQTQTVGWWWGDIEAKLRTGLLALKKKHKYHRHYYEAFQNGDKTEAQKVKCAKTSWTLEMIDASAFCFLHFIAVYYRVIKPVF